MVAISQNDDVIAPNDGFSSEEQEYFIKEFGIDPVKDREPNELGFSYSAVIPLRIRQDFAERVSLRVSLNEDRQRFQLYLWYLEAGTNIIHHHEFRRLNDLDEYIDLAQILLNESLQVRQGFIRLQQLLSWAEGVNFGTFGVKLGIYLFSLFRGILEGLNATDIAEIYRAPFKGGVFHPDLVFEAPMFYRFLDFYGSYFGVVFDPIEQEFFRSLLRLAPAGWLKQNWDELHEVYCIEINLFGEASTFSRLPKSSQKKVLHLLKRNHRYIYCPELDRPDISITPLVSDGAEGVNIFRYERVFPLNLVSIIIRHNLVDGDSSSWEFIISDNERKQGIDIHGYNALFYWPRLGGSFFDNFQLMEVYANALTQLDPHVLVHANKSFLREVETRGLTGHEEPEDDLYFSCLHLEDPSSASAFLHALISNLQSVAPPEWVLEHRQLLDRIYPSHPMLKVKPTDYRALTHKGLGEIRDFFERSFFQTMPDRIRHAINARDDLLRLAWEIYWKLEQSHLGLTFDVQTFAWILAIVAESEVDFDASIKNQLRKIVPTPPCDENASLHTFPLLLALLRDASSYPEGIVLEPLSTLSGMVRMRVDPPVENQDNNVQTQEKRRLVYLDEDDGLRTRHFSVSSFMKKEYATIWKIFCILDPE